MTSHSFLIELRNLFQRFAWQQSIQVSNKKSDLSSFHKNCVQTELEPMDVVRVSYTAGCKPLWKLQKEIGQVQLQ